MALDAKTKALAESVLAWWEEHRFDTISTGDGDSDNVFDEAPDFVILAAEMLGRDKSTL